MKFLLFIVMAVFANSVALSDDDFSSVVIKTTPLGGGLHMLEGAGGNITASIGPDGVLLVDDDFAGMHEKLSAKLIELHGGSPRFIINTHFHYDHTGGNLAFGPTATIIAAREVRDRLMKEQTLWRKQHPAYPHFALPNLTFSGELSIHVNGQDVRVVHFTHGHTDGDTVVFFAQGKVVSMGDLFFAGMYPIFHPEHSGHLEDFVRNIEQVLKLAPRDARIVPGHGPLATWNDLESYHRMIVASIHTVKRAIQRGRSLKEIQRTGLDGRWEPFSHGYRTTDQWLESIYRDLHKGGG